MNLKSIAILASTLIATTAMAQEKPHQSCGAGTCGKKESRHTTSSEKASGQANVEASSKNVGASAMEER